MRVLQLVAADRWTGAAATALQLADALRDTGLECHFAYRPGRNLDQRLAGLGWCHPILAKERSLRDLREVVGRIRVLAGGFDAVVVHLPHDHVLCRFAVHGGHPPVVRWVHHSKHLRADPFHRWLFRTTVGVGLSNTTMLPACQRIPALRGAPAAVMPLALEPRFKPGCSGAAARARLGVPANAFVAGTIGKLDRGRGHDLFIHALAAAPGVWGMIVGKGPHVPALQRLAARLGVTDRLAWPGYVEDGLEDLYAAMDIFVFPAAGSDHAHRAIAEAAGCGIPALAADLPGVRDLVEPGSTGALYPPADAAALAVLISKWARDPSLRLDAGRRAAERARARWTPRRLAEVALGLLRAASI